MKDILVFLIPIVILELILLFISLKHVLTHKKYKYGNRVFWIIICIVLQIIGPVAYLLFGRCDNEEK